MSDTHQTSHDISSLIESVNSRFEKTLEAIEAPEIEPPEPPEEHESEPEEGEEGSEGTEGAKKKPRNRSPENTRDIDGIHLLTYSELVRLAYGYLLPDDVVMSPRALEPPKDSKKKGRWGKKVHQVRMSWAAQIRGPRTKDSRKAPRITAGGVVVQDQGGRAPNTPREKWLREAFLHAYAYAKVQPPHVMPPVKRNPSVVELVQIILDRRVEIPAGLQRRIAVALVGLDLQPTKQVSLPEQGVPANTPPPPSGVVSNLSTADEAPQQDADEPLREQIREKMRQCRMDVDQYDRSMAELTTAREAKTKAIDRLAAALETLT
jgi:hypothetical protein